MNSIRYGQSTGRFATFFVQRLYLMRSRLGLLLLLLAVMAIVMAASFNGLRFSYGLMAARESLREGDALGALEFLDAFADRGGHSAEWQYLHARALRRASFLTDAEREIAQAKELGWNAEDIRREQLLLSARRGKIKKVETQLVELLVSGVDDDLAEEIYEAMSQGYWASFYVEDALNCLEHWRQWQPENLVPRLWIADLYFRSEREDAGIAEYREILKIDANNEEALAKLGESLLRKLQVKQAAEAFSRCLAVSPQNVEALVGLAQCRRRQGATDEVKKLLYRALVQEPSTVQTGQVLGVLGALALEDRDYLRAVRLLQDSAALTPDEPTTHVSLAAALAEIGQEELAAEERDAGRDMSDRRSRLLHVTRKAHSEPENADLRCEAGQILMEQGLWAESADWFNTALEIDPQHRRSHEGLAQFYDHKGEHEQAERHRKAAEQASPAKSALNYQNG